MGYQTQRFYKTSLSKLFARLWWQWWGGQGKHRQVQQGQGRHEWQGQQCKPFFQKYQLYDIFRTTSSSRSKWLWRLQNGRQWRQERQGWQQNIFFEATSYKLNPIFLSCSFESSFFRNYMLNPKWMMTKIARIIHFGLSSWFWKYDNW